MPPGPLDRPSDGDAGRPGDARQAGAVPVAGADGDQTGENTCPACGGRGVVDGATCGTCLGAGTVIEPVGDA